MGFSMDTSNLKASLRFLYENSSAASAMTTQFGFFKSQALKSGKASVEKN